MLHGRERERAQLTALWENAGRARAGALVVTGVAGAGKSALLEDLIAGAVGARLLRTQGLESESLLAFAALHRLLRPVRALLDRLPVPQARALRVAFGEEEGAAVAPFLVAVATLSVLTEAAEDGPVLCVVGDAHWLDVASADALLFAARRLKADPGTRRATDGEGTDTEDSGTAPHSEKSYGDRARPRLSSPVRLCADRGRRDAAPDGHAGGKVDDSQPGVWLAVSQYPAACPERSDFPVTCFPVTWPRSRAALTSTALAPVLDPLRRPRPRRPRLLSAQSAQQHLTTVRRTLPCWWGPGPTGVQRLRTRGAESVSGFARPRTPARSGYAGRWRVSAARCGSESVVK